MNIEIAVIPGGIRDQLKPLDGPVDKAFKNVIHENRINGWQSQITMLPQKDVRNDLQFQTFVYKWKIHGNM